MKQIENEELPREGFLSKPYAVTGVLLGVVFVAFWWLWQGETEETISEVGAEADLQRVRLDLDVLAAVEAIGQVEFLSGAGLSSADFQKSLERAVLSDPGIMSLRVLSRDGSPVLSVVESNGEAEVLTGPQETPGIADRFWESLRSLPEGDILVSEFSRSDWSGNDVVVKVGSGLFFGSGERAGFLVAELDANRLVQGMESISGGAAQDLFIVGGDGRWIYDPRTTDRWPGVASEGESRWMTDEFPSIWRTMISEGMDSYTGEDIWVFREHTPLETLEPEQMALLDSEDSSGISARPFYVVRKVNDAGMWSEIWSAVIPLLLLFLLSIMVLLPALHRRREALAQADEAERGLEEATLRTRVAMDAAQISEWTIDLDAGTIATDRRTANMMLVGTGNPIQSVENWMERIHPNDRRKVMDQLETVWQQKKGNVNTRHRMLRGDESWGWFRFRGAVRKRGAEDQPLIVGAYIDLTDVVLREAELHRLEMATAQSLSGITILDKEGVVEWANASFQARPERRNVSVVGRFIWELFPFQSAEEVDQQGIIREAIYKGDEFSFTVAVHPSGEEASWRRVTGNPVLDEGGIPTNYVVIESDISKEKRTEADLRTSEALLSESQKLADIGSWEIDCEEETLYWSEQTYRIFGVGEEFVPSLSNQLDFYVAADQEKIRMHLEMAIREGSQFEGEFRLGRDGDPEPRWVFLKGMAMREADVTVKVFGVVEDISGRKDHEKALLEAKNEAEKLNEQLAEALEKTRESERKAMEANRAKSAFLSMISHEIRNPLNGVIGMTDLLRDTSLDALQKDYLETIQNSGSSVMMLLNDILDFSKIEHGKVEFEQKQFSISDAVEESLLLFSSKISEKGLDHGLWIEKGVPETVVGDVTRVKQILFNLIGNAVKFTEEGAVTVEVELRERMPNDRCLLAFRVRDTGMGIPKDRHDRIFQSFSQVDPSITRKFGGSGLGLAISKELSQRMGGDLTFESGAGEGSLFQLLLPFPSIFEKDGKSRTVDREDASGLGLFVLETRAKNFSTELRERGIELQVFTEEDQFVEEASKAGKGDWIFMDEELAETPKIQSLFRSRPVARGFRSPVVITRRRREDPIGYDVKFLQRPGTRKRIDELLDPEPGIAEKTDAPEKAKTKPPAKMKILIAEDNKVNQKVIRLLLKRLGYECEIVENGRLALERVREGGIDVILMDIQMPEMDGIEASERIGSEVAEEDRPWIIALTAGATRDNEEDALRAGMSGYLTKPVQPADLEVELDKAYAHLRKRN